MLINTLLNGQFGLELQEGKVAVKYEMEIAKQQDDNKTAEMSRKVSNQ